MRPIEIVGGGVGGLALGLALRRSGVPVTLFEAEDYPRHRVCGEFISGLDGSTRGALGLTEILAGAVPHRAVTYFLRGEALPPFALPGIAWGISRLTLDARLARTFAAAGGDLRTQTRVPEEAAPEGRVFAAGRRRKGPFWVGLKVHVHGLKLANDFEVHLGDRAYVGLSKVETGAVNVCGIFAQRESASRGIDLIADYLGAAGLENLAARLLDADVERGSFCVTAAPLGDRRIAATDRIRIGDACASIPPFTGNGLAMALQGAAAALGPLRAYASGTASWEDTIREVGRRHRLQFRRRLMVASFLHPFFLERRRQGILAALARRRLIPFPAFYAAIH